MAADSTSDPVFVPSSSNGRPADPDASGLFCNRTLNLRRIQAIGYDMDYTLVHYRMSAWEQRAYSYLKNGLLADDWPIEHLTFQPDLVTRGLILDVEEGNVVKANRFGYIKHAFHGTRPMNHKKMRQVYERTLVDLEEDRWFFLNTLFSISEACMYMQLVDLLDEDRLAHSIGYEDLYRRVRRTLDAAHMEGLLKREIVDNPDRFVELDEEMPLALLDQKEAGKAVLLITNSGWAYADAMLRYAMDPFLPGEMTWRDLFDVAIVGAQKPDFFSVRIPAFEVVSEDGLLRPHRGAPERGKVYVGGNAALVEKSLGLTGEEILYVGDHLFADVNITKSVMRWRTALVMRELEDEIEALRGFEAERQALTKMMREKEAMEAQFSAMRLERQRNEHGYGRQTDRSPAALDRAMHALRERLVALDRKIAPLAQAADALLNPHWGTLMRTGKDKSHMARQVERYADIYTARVSNFLRYTPFAYLRSHRGTFPHDEGIERPD